MRHVLVKDGERLVGAVRVNTGIRQGLEGTYTGVKLGEVAPRNFTIVREDDVVFDVIDRMWRKKADMALVVRTRGVPWPRDVLGVITKEHVADSVASSIRVYPG
jgi:chloride channel protein, CIC family